MNFGIFHLSGEVSLGNVITISMLVWNLIKFGGRIIQATEHVDEMWSHFDTTKGIHTLPNRVKRLERRTTTIWTRLRFNHLIDTEEP